MSVRALSFGAVAAAYEQFRPAYPTELVDAVIKYTAQPIRTALEIGAGTGRHPAYSLSAGSPSLRPSLTPMSGRRRTGIMRASVHVDCG